MKKGNIIDIENYRNKSVKTKEVKRITIIKNDGTFIADMVLGDDNIILREGYNVLLNKDYIRIE